MRNESQPAHATILFVDDDEDFLTQNMLRFSEAGYTVAKASSCKEAEKSFAETKPDLVVLDLMMEEKDAGMILAHRFKSLNPNLPIVMVTGITRETGLVINRQGAEDKKFLKVDKVLAKPIKFEQLRREINILLNK